MKTSIFFLLMTIASMAVAQTSQLPYYEIPKEADRYTAGTVGARMIDGLGFRYRWATDSLRNEDLNYSPSAGARTSLETLVHIYELSMIIVNATTSTANEFPDTKSMTFDQLRAKTLDNLYNASNNLRKASDEDVKGFKAIFKRQSGTREFPFWNMINGPIADALWHVGQVVSFRRASGNPFTEKISVFTGTVNK
jgi:hypothetical protein